MTTTVKRIFAGAARGLSAVLLLLLIPVVASAQTGGAQPSHSAASLNPDHQVLAAPLPVESTADAVEVVELFWYGCPHCFALEPTLERWIAAQPKDVRVRRLPAVLTDGWEPAAHLFYTLEALGEIERLHRAVFDAEHAEGSLRVQSRNEDHFADWAAKHGIAKAQFTAAWRSPTVLHKVNQATRLTLPFRRIGVPALIIDGRFLTTATLAGTPQAMLEAADRLIAEVRAKRAGMR